MPLSLIMLADAPQNPSPDVCCCKGERGRSSGEAWCAAMIKLCSHCCYVLVAWWPGSLVVCFDGVLCRGEDMIIYEKDDVACNGRQGCRKAGHRPRLHHSLDCIKRMQQKSHRRSRHSPPTIQISLRAGNLVMRVSDGQVGTMIMMHRPYAGSDTHRMAGGGEPTCFKMYRHFVPPKCRVLLHFPSALRHAPPAPSRARCITLESAPSAE